MLQTQSKENQVTLANRSVIALYKAYEEFVVTIKPSDIIEVKRKSHYDPATFGLIHSIKITYHKQ